MRFIIEKDVELIELRILLIESKTGNYHLSQSTFSCGELNIRYNVSLRFKHAWHLVLGKVQCRYKDTTFKDGKQQIEFYPPDLTLFLFYYNIYAKNHETTCRFLLSTVGGHGYAGTGRDIWRAIGQVCPKSRQAFQLLNNIKFTLFI